MATLFELTEQMRNIDEVLEINDGELTPELEGMWTETRESLLKKVDAYNALYQKSKSDAKACKDEICRLSSIMKTAERKQERIKSHLLNTMLAFDLNKMEGQTCKMYSRNSTSLQVDEEEVLSGWMLLLDEISRQLPSYISLQYKVSKTDLKSLEALPSGCQYVENKTLVIK